MGAVPVESGLHSVILSSNVLGKQGKLRVRTLSDAVFMLASELDGLDYNLEFRPVEGSLHCTLLNWNPAVVLSVHRVLGDSEQDRAEGEVSLEDIDFRSAISAVFEDVSISKSVGE